MSMPIFKYVPPSYLQPIENRPGNVISSSFKAILVIDFGGHDHVDIARHILEASQNPPPMYLRFGSNITPPQSSTTIKLLPYTLYAVNMVDLGVNGEQLHIDNRLLYPDNITIKGLIVDSGSSMSYLTQGAYDLVVRKLDQHFSKYKGEFIKLDVGNKLCYSRTKGVKEYNNIPGVTYYFEGGSKLDVIPEATFTRKASSGKSEMFCLTIHPTKVNLNVLGSFQQVNVKFIFNIKDETLQFGREDCAKNG
ncbi:unnamed protein product [Lupinus luteus]|uniref:Peptidase A1 domain-containing protein n=1 Tax=Lupinus luteus TaxID=3873 RepID=A0AAV1X803_LUPLU